MQESTLYAGTDTQTLQYIQAHLDDDMELLAHQQHIQPALLLSPNPPFNTNNNGSDCLVLQILMAEDISLQAIDRLKALASSVGDPNNNNNTANAIVALSPDEEGADNRSNNHNNNNSIVSEELQEVFRQLDGGNDTNKSTNAYSPNRCLKLLLTDGFSRIIAVEKRVANLPPLLGEGVVLGAKIKIKLSTNPIQNKVLLGTPLYAHGVLRLSSKETTAMGGVVRALLYYSGMEASTAVQRRSGKPIPSREAPMTVQQNNNNSVVVPAVPVAANTVRPVNPTTVVEEVAAPLPTPTPNNNNPTTNNNTNIDTEGTLVLRPLSQYKQFKHTQKYAPFLTEVVIEEVISDLVIAPQYGSSNNHNNNSNEPILVFSLMAQVVSPDSVHHIHHHDHTSEAITVDLGNFWLEQLIGMNANQFQLLTQNNNNNNNNNNMNQINAIIERMGNTLQQLNSCEVVLVERIQDAVVEITDVRRVS
ncbi:RecQ mediated genome instability protein, putative [Angomonas deanei]|uniref:RecQ mediated genome instability protein, putative n=1 Tax=Angomonas deanei TaxID=59799 RepID=A0A7G2CCX3_9TRYP|nr:RecQ mediated genome instability protein, putative [Angomonas deanei]